MHLEGQPRQIVQIQWTKRSELQAQAEDGCDDGRDLTLDPSPPLGSAAAVHSFMVAMSSNCHRCASLRFPAPPCIAVRQAHAYTPGSRALNIRCLLPFGHARPVTHSSAAPQWLLPYPSQMHIHDRIHVRVRCSPSL